MRSVELYSCGSCYSFSQQLAYIAYFNYFLRVKRVKCTAILYSLQLNLVPRSSRLTVQLK